MTLNIGYVVGSLASDSINRTLAMALIRLAPDDMEFVEIEIARLPVYNRDLDTDFPLPGIQLKQAILAADALLFVTPEYNRSIPGALKNALDWATRPEGENTLAGKPSATIGTSRGAIGTALAQQHLRTVLTYLKSPQFCSREAHIRFTPEMFTPDGCVRDAPTMEFLHTYLAEFRDFIIRVRGIGPVDPAEG